MIKRVLWFSALAAVGFGSASLVKRSEIALSCNKGGRRIWTSGSRQVGSWIEATASGAKTVTATDWVMVVSRSDENGVGGSSFPPSSSVVEASSGASEGRR